MTRGAWNGVLSGAMLGVLVFGASQAFAAPPPASERLACSPTACRKYCVDTCPPWATSCMGACQYDVDPTGRCVCEYW